MVDSFLGQAEEGNKTALLKLQLIGHYIMGGDFSITDLSHEMNLSVPTVTKLVSELIEEGFVHDFGKQGTAGGRRPNIYGLNPYAGYFVGVDIKKDIITLAIINFKGQVVELSRQVAERFGRLDILVNNAGVLSNTPYDEITEVEWDRVLDINLKGVLFASSEALKPMRARGWGRIINISSLAGRNGGVSVGPAYVASKAALIGLTRHLAKKVARDGVTVNAVAPGTTETDIIKGFNAEQMAAINDAIPVGRLGQPDEIAQTVAFLASDSAAFITGAVIDVNGGMYMG